MSEGTESGQSDKPKPEVTEIMGFPVLTDADKRALLEEPDRGVQRATGVKRFSTFEDWMNTGGLRGKNNFWAHFSDSFIEGEGRRESPYAQRYLVLEPEQFDRLSKFVAPFKNPAVYRDTVIPEDVERDFWRAYETMANLVDARDPGINDGNKDHPEGQAFPFLLSS